MPRLPLVDEASLIARRNVLLAVGIGLLVASRLGRGQPQAKTPRIGVLWALPAGDPTVSQYRAIFLKRLYALGYVEGKSILIEERSAEGHAERLGDLARELAASKVDVIVAPTGHR